MQRWGPKNNPERKARRQAGVLTFERAARKEVEPARMHPGTPSAVTEPLSGELEPVYLMLPIHCHYCGTCYPSEPHLEACEKARNG